MKIVLIGRLKRLEKRRKFSRSIIEGMLGKCPILCA